MNTSSKLKKNTKTQTKPTTVRKQTSRKANEQLTSRASKQLTKKKQSQDSGHKAHRSPQMIKMMINQLQKQLAEKTKFSKTLNEGQFRSTARKLASPKNTQIGSKTLTSTQNGWRSPIKKKTKDIIIESSDKGSSKLLQKSISQKGPMKKKKIVYSSIEPFDTSESNKKIESKIQPSKPKQKKIKKQKGTDFIFLGDDLIKLDNIQIPLFIVQNNKTDLERSKRFSSRNQKFIEVDERSRSSYLRHSKISSISSVNTDKSLAEPVKFIQRSFVEGQQRKINQQDIVFLNNTNNFFNKNQNNQNNSSTLSTKKTIKNADPVFDIHQVILLNNSVVKIQKWWKKMLQNRQLKKKLLNLKEMLQMAAKIRTQTVVKKQIQKQNIVIPQGEKINLSQIQADIQVPTLSEKTIQPANSQSQYEDILKMRQTAANMQFSTHEQILKQLLSKGKINLPQYNEKLTKIKLNLQKELNDIKNIKKILRQSAKKVETMIKKTKDDILVVKQITNTKQQPLSESRISQQYEQKIKQNTKKDEILSTIFGKQQQTKQLSIENNSQLKDSPQKVHYEKRYQKTKLSTYQKDIEQFLNQDSDDNNSFVSNQNRKVFNSPNSNSQEDLCSPKSNKSDYQNLDDIPQYAQNIDEATFASQISQVPISCVNEVQSENAQAPMQTAHFQQLYKQYQQQQQTKKQIESRISKQLGVTDPQDLLPKSQNAVGINTSIVGIHKFLLNFFKFYLYYHKNQFINFMNMPYGESIETRLGKNKQKDSHIELLNWTKTTLYTDDDQQIIYGLKEVIPESVLEDFFESYYQQTDVQFTEVEKANIQLQKIHNKAVFEAFNLSLNFFRPYFNIGGAPYLWCSSQKSLTFYCIGEENIQQVYEKTQLKILKTSSYLCGPHIDVPHKNKVQFLKNNKVQEKQCEQINSPFKIMQIQQKTSKSLNIKNDFKQFLFSYTQNFNPAYFANLEDRLKKKQLAEAEQENSEWFSNTFQESKVSILLNLTDLILQMIFKEQSQNKGKKISIFNDKIKLKLQQILFKDKI